MFKSHREYKLSRFVYLPIKSFTSHLLILYIICIEMKKRLTKIPNKSLPLIIIALCLLIGLIIFVLVLQSRQTANTRAAEALVNCEVSEDKIALDSEEQTFLQLLNEYRQQNNAEPLKISATLTRAAAWMSNDQAVHDVMNHTDSLGRNPGTRMTNCGYDYSTTRAEDLAKGTTTAQSVLSSWKASENHNINLLNPAYKVIGIARDFTPSGYAYWTTDFGAYDDTTAQPTLPISTPGTSATPTPTIPQQATPTPIINVNATPTTRPSITPTPWPANVPTPTPVPGFVAKPDDTQVYASIKINGIGSGGNARPKHLSRYAQIEVFDLSNKSVALGNADLTYDGRDLFRGIIHLGKISNGTYYIKIGGKNTLVRIVKPQFQQLNNATLNVLPPVNLIPGDINKDNMIDVEDYNETLPCFQNKRCEDRDIIDFNDDGTTDAIDYNILLYNFWESQGD